MQKISKNLRATKFTLFNTNRLIYKDGEPAGGDLEYKKDEPGNKETSPAEGIPADLTLELANSLTGVLGDLAKTGDEAPTLDLEILQDPNMSDQPEDGGAMKLLEDMNIGQDPEPIDLEDE